MISYMFGEKTLKKKIKKTKRGRGTEGKKTTGKGGQRTSIQFLSHVSQSQGRLGMGK